MDVLMEEYGPKMGWEGGEWCPASGTQAGEDAAGVASSGALMCASCSNVKWGGRQKIRWMGERV